MNTPIAEGFYGFPVAKPQDHGPARGTIEWLLEAVERHASAEQDALAEYEFVALTPILATRSVAGRARSATWRCAKRASTPDWTVCCSK